MSLRPRFGDGGRLRLLEGQLSPHADGWTEIVGSIAGDRDWDPFERTSSGLLLAEDFARARLDDVGTLRAWITDHGALDLRHTFPADSWQPYRDPQPSDTLVFLDPIDQYPVQQDTVRWHLLSLARLSQDPGIWQSQWMTVGLRCQEPLLIDASESAFLRYLQLGDDAASRGIPTIWVPYSQWWDGWSALAVGEHWPAHPGQHLTADRAGHLELLRRLLEPHVRIAARFEVELPWPDAAYPMLVTEQRRWRSVLSPIYLQLLEGLRRVTEGQRGAAFCKECGEPFLTLDARRSSFCNDQHRFRFSQRARRGRLEKERAAQDALTRVRWATKGTTTP